MKARTIDQGITDIPLNEIDLRDLEFQPRIGPPAGVDDLVEDMRINGQLVPVTVKIRKGTAPPYQLVSGFRRASAAKRLRWKCISAIVYSEDMPAFEVHRRAVSDNLVRKSISDLECAQKCHKLRQEGYSTERIAEIFNKSRRTIERYLVIANADDEIRAAILEGIIGISVAYEIIKRGIPLREAIDGEAYRSVRAVRRLSESTRKKQVKGTIKKRFMKNGNFTLRINFRKGEMDSQEVEAALKEALAFLNEKS